MYISIQTLIEHFYFYEIYLLKFFEHVNYKQQIFVASFNNLSVLRLPRIYYILNSNRVFHLVN